MREGTSALLNLHPHHLELALNVIQDAVSLAQLLESVPMPDEEKAKLLAHRDAAEAASMVLEAQIGTAKTGPVLLVPTPGVAVDISVNTHALTLTVRVSEAGPYSAEDDEAGEHVKDVSTHPDGVTCDVIVARIVAACEAFGRGLADEDIRAISALALMLAPPTETDPPRGGPSETQP